MRVVVLMVTPVHCKFYRVVCGQIDLQNLGSYHNDPQVVPGPERCPEIATATNLHHELPPKPISATEESKMRGYFPISWRVIGGGVLMGDPTSSFSDTPLRRITLNSFGEHRERGL